jgi:serine/threonine protein kinase
MDDRRPSVKCACGHSFDIAPEQAFSDVHCPKCSKVIKGIDVAPKQDTTKGTKALGASPKTETPTGPKTDPTAPKVDTTKAGKAVSTGPKTDPFAPKADSTKGGAPGTTRRPPQFMKEGPLPSPIPGYTFLKRLGQGGMGEVLLAKQESLDRLVAVKLLPAEFSKDKVYIEGFMKEARSAGKVTHENVMGAVDVGECNGRYHFVMEYVQGETLFRLIKQQKTIPESKALDIARQVARGLRHAHQMGIIHRDIKPQNILITPDGMAKICDFGLATEIKSSDAQEGEDEENVHTTPAYASPEQCRAEPLDHRTDIYSLGVTLYEMLSGRRPFIASTPKDLMTKQVTEQPQPPKSINPALSEAANQLVLKMLKKQKDERPKTYDDLIAAIDAVAKPAPPKTVRADGPEEPAPRKPLPLIIGAAAAAVILVIVLIVVLTRKGPPPAVNTANATLDPEIQRKLEDMRSVQKSAMGRPGEYPAVRAKWKALEDQYAKTPHRALFAGGRVDFEAAINAEAEAAAKEAVDEASKALEDGRPADAVAALRRFPPEFTGTPAGSRVAAKALEIERANDDKFRDELQAVNTLFAAGKFDEARQKLMNFRASSALDAGADVRPQVRQQVEDLLRRIDTAIADAKKKPVEPTVKATDPEVKPTDPKPVDSKGPTPVKAPEVAILPPAAAPHFLVLRDATERSNPEKRAAAASFFNAGVLRSAFHHAAGIFLSREESAWRMDGAVAAGLQEYLASPELNSAEPSKRSEPFTPEKHQRLLELLVQKIAGAGTAPVEALQLFACAHLQEILAKKGKVDPALLIQAKFAKGPVSDLWGLTGSVMRVELAGLLLKPPGLWVPRAAEAAAPAPDFATRYLGTLCVIKDQTFDAAAAIDRWKKLGAGAPDPALWTKFCDAVADRIKQEMTCEACLGQGRYNCSACSGTGAMICATCRGTGKVVDPSEGNNVTCKACTGRRAIACSVCLGAKSAKCPACDAKKTRPFLTGTHYRLYIDLALCHACGGTGNLFTSVAFPCFSCDGNGRSIDGVLKEYAKLPAWATKGREGRMLHASLRWLARHQAPEGFWGPATWPASCPEPGCKASPAAALEIGITSLTVTAFLNAGFGPESAAELGGVSVGPVIKKALAWLVAQQGPDGLIAHGASIKPVFENNLATWALFSAAQIIQPSEAFPDKDRSMLRETALRSLKWALTAQAKGGGWGYTVGAASDTWVTSWGAMACLAARDAGVEIPKLNLGYLLVWLDSVTDKKDFHLGYNPTQMGKVNLTGNETYVHHDTLSALGSLARLQIEGKPSSTYAAADKQIEKDLPNPDPLRRDYCYWYFGTVYASFHEQRRGVLWTQWTQALLREQLALQEATDTCTMGSFPVTERWCAMGGRVYASAMNALTLTQLIGTRPTPPTKK